MGKEGLEGLGRASEWVWRASDRLKKASKGGDSSGQVDGQTDGNSPLCSVIPVFRDHTDQ